MKKQQHQECRTALGRDNPEFPRLDQPSDRARNQGNQCKQSPDCDEDPTDGNTAASAFHSDESSSSNVSKSNLNHDKLCMPPPNEKSASFQLLVSPQKPQKPQKGDGSGNGGGGGAVRSSPPVRTGREKSQQRSRMLASINNLARHLPATVLDYIAQEVRESSHTASTALQQQPRRLSEVSTQQSRRMSELSKVTPDSPTMVRQPSTDSVYSKEDIGGQTLPVVSYYQSVLMFLDVSGFTALSILLDPEDLSRTMNNYMELLLDEVFEFEGEVQKFAGDAFFAEWRPSAKLPLEKCVQAAAACAAAIVQNYSDFPVLTRPEDGSSGSSVSRLNIHIGLSLGQMAGVHVGDNTRRREYFFLGEPVAKAADACDHAVHGEVAASSEFYSILKTGTTTMAEEEEISSPSSSSSSSSAENNNSSLVIATKTTCLFDRTCCTSNPEAAHAARLQGVTPYVSGINMAGLVEYRRLLSLYVHPVVAAATATCESGSQDDLQAARQGANAQDESELRGVYVAFIKPILPMNLKGNEQEDWSFVCILNQIMRLVTRVLSHYHGQLRQFIVDDKGTVLIATWGLRGSTFPNLVAERALPATKLIHQLLLQELDVQSRIGATFGDVYCGTVGAPYRHEYAVMGRSVNLAARLMCSPSNSGILVDSDVHRMASRSYNFESLPPVTAKGYNTLVPIFEPGNPISREWGSIVPYFVGRDKDRKTIQRLLQKMHTVKDSPAKILIVSAASGTGKSTLLAHAVDDLNSLRLEDCTVVTHVARECDSVDGFSTMKVILQSIFQVWAEKQNKGELKGCNTDEDVKRQEIFAGICSELRVDRKLRRYLEGMIWGDSTKGRQSRSFAKPDANAVADFYADAFLRCQEDQKLTVVAIDDAHGVDEMSWKVLRKLFNRGRNLVILGAWLPGDAHHIETDFWEELANTNCADGRFLQLELGMLNKSEVIEMIAKSLNMEQDEISAELVDEVMVQSGGNPQFARKILNGIRRRRSSLDSVGSEVEDSLLDIILHRVDSFDSAMRSTLNVAAVLGESFNLGQVIRALKEEIHQDESEMRRGTIESLQAAVREGILTCRGNCIHESRDLASTIDDFTEFVFSRTIWRSTLLSLMLVSRKRDTHRKIARSMGKYMVRDSTTFENQAKLAYHWHSSGDSNRATVVALSCGLNLKGDRKKSEKLLCLFEDILMSWGWRKDEFMHSGGFALDVLEILKSSDLDAIAALMIACAKVNASLSLNVERVRFYESAINVAACAKETMTDRSLLFPAFAGLLKAIEADLVAQDEKCQYEQGLTWRFLEEAKSYGRPIHIIHALAAQQALYSRLGQIEKAIITNKMIRRLYKPKNHSCDLFDTYGSDMGALSISSCSLLNLLQGMKSDALELARGVFRDLLPCIDCDLDARFKVAYPALLVLKDSGVGDEALSYLEDICPGKCGEWSDKQKQSHESLAEALRMLLKVSLSANEKRGCWDVSIVAHFANLDARQSSDVESKGRYNFTLERMGCRCKKTILAEICTVLAPRLPAGATRMAMIMCGKRLVSQAIESHQKHTLILSLRQAYAVEDAVLSLERNARQMVK